MATESQQAPAAKKSGSKKWLLIIGGCLLLIVLAVVAFVVFVFNVINSATAAPLETSEQFLVYLEDGDSQRAYDMTSTTFQGATTEDQFQIFVDQMEPVDFSKAEIASKNISNDISSGSLASLTYDVDQDDADYTVEIELSYDGSEWLINYVTVNPK
jgi:hypothetical protein